MNSSQNIPPNLNPSLQVNNAFNLQRQVVCPRLRYIPRVYNLNQDPRYLQGLNYCKNLTRAIYSQNANSSGYLLSEKLPDVPYIQNNNINNININFQQLGNDEYNQRNLQRLQSHSLNQIQDDKCEDRITSTSLSKEEEHATINVYFLPSNNCMSFVPGKTENDKKYKILYEKRKGVRGKMKLKIVFEDINEKSKIIFGDINEKFTGITSVNIIQTNIKNNNSKDKDQTIFVNGKKEVNIDLLTNYGNNKYETEILFKRDNEVVIKFLIELATTRGNRDAKNKRKTKNIIKTKLIHDLLPEYNSDLILAIVEEINKKVPNFFESKKVQDFFEGLYKYLKEKNIKELLGEKDKNEFLEQIQNARKEGFNQSILTNIENFFNEIEDDEKKNKLLIMCFDYLYIRTIEAIKNIKNFSIFNSFNSQDESIIGYFYLKYIKFLGEYGSGYCKKNDVIIIGKIKDRKRSCEIEDDEYYRKRQKMNINARIDGRQTIESSDSENFIS